MNTLEKRLIEIAQDSHKQGESIVQEVRLLLADTAQEERNTLKSIGLDNDLRMAEDKNQDIIIRHQASQHLGKQVLKYDDIKKLCLNYRLYMKPAREYVGTIPLDLGAELTRFCNEKKIPLPANSNYSNFYIIAPPKMFKDYLSPMQVIDNAFTFAEQQAAQRKRLRDEDPILVYQLPEKDYYAVIKSWGSDFTPLRRVYGFLTTKKSVKWLNIAITLLGLVLLFQLAKTYTVFCLEKASHYKNGHAGWEILIMIGDISICIVSCIWMFNNYLNDVRVNIKRMITEKQLK